MAWLNYHHLLYFWTVARAGTIAAASKELHLSQPTISTQLKTLEESLGQKLFQRQGRKLVLTDVGQTTFRYADEIFRLGKELQKSLETGGAPGTGLRFAVGVADVIPKLVAQRLLEPAFDAVPLLQLECHEGPLPQLLAQLALHELDVVLADSPAPADIKVKAFSHALGESGTTFFARPGQAASLRRGFPKTLDGTPMLLPSRATTVRRQLEIWLDSLGVRPKVVAEFDDSALLMTFGMRGRGVFAAPTVIEDEVCRQYDVQVVGRTEDVTERFWAISVERRLRHAAVVAVADSARRELFGKTEDSRR
ncbi:MAG: LysR family transcriptional regulator [Myxococcaceae bacterium]|nr:LysR family transcriptional regulator [Myxococcaceae bacterium]